MCISNTTKRICRKACCIRTKCKKTASNIKLFFIKKQYVCNPQFISVRNLQNNTQLIGLYAIAAVVLGGCSLRGGKGSVLGIVIGSALIAVLRNIIILPGIEDSLDFAVMGTVILISVVVDQILQRRREEKLS